MYTVFKCIVLALIVQITLTRTVLSFTAPPACISPHRRTPSSSSHRRIKPLPNCPPPRAQASSASTSNKTGDKTSMAAAASFGLAAYLRRIGLDLATRTPSLAVLTSIMSAQSRAIAFENLDVVQKKIIQISPADVEQKLVKEGRGGYCFEQNQLLASALQSLGFHVFPMLCRVRWNKAPDEQTTWTHIALGVNLGGEGSTDGGPARTYLADVGFAGTNSIAPVLLGSDEPQALPEGLFRTVRNGIGDTTLQWQIKDSWRDLYVSTAFHPARTDVHGATAPPSASTSSSQNMRAAMRL